MPIKIVKKNDAAIKKEAPDELVDAPAASNSNIIAFKSSEPSFEPPAQDWLGLVEPDLDEDPSFTTELSEDSLAHMFVSEQGASTLFDHSDNCWRLWNGCSWREDKTRAVFHRIREFVRDRRKGQKHLATARAVENIERMASRDRRVARTSDDWDSDPWALGTPDGYVDLRTGVLSPAKREDLITRLTSVGPADESNCPEFRAFLDQATGGDAQLQRFLQQYLGYSLTGVTNEQVLVFIYGPGGNVTCH